jgi:DNA-binding GntR family transcriptional regulator
LETKYAFDHQLIRQIERSRDLSDFVYEAIRELIISGRISAGARLKQLDLAKQLDVSQQTVREALKRLAASGLATQKPNRGFSVTTIPIEDQENIYKIRAALEGLAAYEAAPQITDDSLARMRKLLPTTAQSDQTIPLDTVRTSNREFHMIIVRSTLNRHLIRIMEQLWDLTWTYFYRVDDEDRKKSANEDLTEHGAILEALESRDAERARELMIEHIHITWHSLCGARQTVQKTTS